MKQDKKDALDAMKALQNKKWKIIKNYKSEKWNWFYEITWNLFNFHL